MNTNDIQRYTASFPLQKEFITNSDGCGDNIFKQVKREGNVCIYSRTKVGCDKPWAYEVIVTKTIKAGTLFSGGNVVKKDYETYPGSAAFGRIGWFHPNLESAENKFSSVVNKENEVPTEKPTKDLTQTVKPVKKSVVYDKIPDGEFSQAGFAQINGLPERGVVYMYLHNLIDRGLVKESRRVQIQSKGRPTVLFIKS